MKTAALKTKRESGKAEKAELAGRLRGQEVAEREG